MEHEVKVAYRLFLLLSVVLVDSDATTYLEGTKRRTKSLNYWDCRTLLRRFGLFRSS